MSQKMKLLIAYDGSECADAALDDLRRAGLPRDTEAVVLTVADVWGPPALPAAYDRITSDMDREIRARAQELRQHMAQAVEEARLLAVNASQRIQSMFPVWAVSAEACAGTPGWELIKKADELQPDLLVVGSHGRTALGRAFLGSVSQKVVTESNCSVRVARGSTAASDAPARLVVGIDGSPYAEAALHAIVARQWPQGSEIRIVHAEFKLPPSASGGLGEHENAAMQMAEWIAENNYRIRQMIETTSERLQVAGLKTSTVVKEEDPKCLLLEEAESWGADCIFAGARGLGRFQRFLLGSVSTAVAARAHCSVEIVRTEEIAS